MKKYIKIIVLLTITLVFLLGVNSFARSSILTSINLNNIDWNSIDENKIEDIKDVINNIDTASIVNEIDTSATTSGNFTNINISEVIDIYNQLSDVITNDEIADLLKDNSDLLEQAGVSSQAISVSETLLRTFDADAIIDIVQNDIDLDELLTMYKNGSSLENILTHVIAETSPQTKLSIISKLLFSNLYFRIALVVLVLVCIYSIFITSIIFKKANKPRFGAIIPIYRDVLHLKICGLSPYLLLLIFVPILGWLMLIAIAIIGRFELSKKFEHGFFFGLGLLLFPIIFRTIIAFSNNEYIEDLYEK